MGISSVSGVRFQVNQISFRRCNMEPQDVPCLFCNENFNKVSACWVTTRRSEIRYHPNRR